ncbi:hypothetical protein GOODEAATRI_028813 [Goodea atripinnis]|uniref:Uncharacterized protein n=1 Tax=Goodea atripinnis TaxID=208336 RepID=A0ABV0PSX1_9TELE
MFRVIVTLHPSLQSSAANYSFSFRIVLHLAPSIFRSTLTSIPTKFYCGDGVFWLFYLTRSPYPNVCSVPYRASGKLQTGPLMPFFHKGQFVKCMTDSCTIDNFFCLSSGSLQLLQSHYGPLGCFSD